MKQLYIDKNFHVSSRALLEKIDVVLAEYAAQGYILTVRQLYYQLVARGFIANNMKEYKHIVNLVTDARLAGLIDWEAIEDRTRDFVKRPHWHSGGSIIQSCADQFHMDMWRNQPIRPFVIIEKEALTGVLATTCRQYDIPLLAARGYPSGSVLRDFARDDIMTALQDGQEVFILHLGDHDPSGIDMTRDLEDRLALFAECEASVFNLKRLALNMNQIKSQKPPENPAKPTDSRYAGYRKKFGDSSWELDALSPKFLNKLITDFIEPYIDHDEWEAREELIVATRVKLQRTADRFDKAPRKRK